MSQTLHGPVGEVPVTDPAQVVGVISDFRTEHGISHRVPCRALGVSESWFYKHRTSSPPGGKCAASV